MLYQDVYNPKTLQLNCSGTSFVGPDASYNCAWSPWSKQFIGNANDLYAGCVGWACTQIMLTGVYNMSDAPAKAAFVGTGAVLAGHPPLQSLLQAPQATSFSLGAPGS